MLLKNRQQIEKFCNDAQKRLKLAPSETSIDTLRGHYYGDAAEFLHIVRGLLELVEFPDEIENDKSEEPDK